MAIWKPVLLAVQASVLAAGLAGLFQSTANAAELLMLERRGCVWCDRWHAEIGPIYAKTREGAVAPLRRIDLDGEWPDDLENIVREHVTPTFVLVHDGEEIDRLRGYAGDQFFWFLVDEMLRKLPNGLDTSG
ncbi:MAG: transcriptional regulator [Rhizobiaceae bacterium]